MIWGTWPGSPVSMALVFVFGAIIGSFLNVVGLRLLREESFVGPRSYCYHCQTPIQPWDNIPILSWLLLGGRCRQCRTPIHWQYPVVEAATGGLFVALVWHFGWTLPTLFYAVLVCNLVLVTITDLREQYIFDINSWGLIPVGLLFHALDLGQTGWWHDWHWGGIGVSVGLLWALLALGASMAIFGGLNLISNALIGKPGFGEGDTRLLMGIGAFLGAKLTLVVFLASFVIQVVVGMPVLLVQWLRQKAYSPFFLLTSSFILVAIPYLIQATLALSPLFLMILSLGLGAIAMVCVFKAIRLAKDLPGGLTYLPFGPAIVLAALLVLFRLPAL